MKLMDADELNARMYRKSFETDDGRQQWNGGLWIRYKIFEEARDETPTIEAEPVIRCKDCKWWKTNYSWNGKEHKVCVIEAYEPPRKAEDFCSRAERKEE